METQTNSNQATPETVWALLQEIGEKQKENERVLTEMFKETDRSITRLEKQMGSLHNSFGELAEHLVAPGIAQRFNELDYHFSAVSPGGQRILDEKGKVLTEIDLLLENSDCIMAVEVKTKPKVQDVEHHIKRLEILRKNRSKQRDMRKIQGAIAGAVFGSEEKKAVLEAGLYVLEQSGDTMKIDIPDSFVPREW